MSAADELRQAAATLRERASDPTNPGPWSAVARPGTGQAWIDMPDIDGHAIGMHGFTFEAQYIATVHPGVGLALADWLDWEADEFEHVWSAEGCEMGERFGGLVVARLINGGAS